MNFRYIQYVSKIVYCFCLFIATCWCSIFRTAWSIIYCFLCTNIFWHWLACANGNCSGHYDNGIFIECTFLPYKYSVLTVYCTVSNNNVHYIYQQTLSVSLVSTVILPVPCAYVCTAAHSQINNTSKRTVFATSPQQHCSVRFPYSKMFNAARNTAEQTAIILIYEFATVNYFSSWFSTRKKGPWCGCEV